MTNRTKMVNGVAVPMGAEENAERDSEEAAWAMAAPLRAAAEVDAGCGMARWQRDVVILVLPGEHPQRAKADAAEKAVIALGIR